MESNIKEIEGCCHHSRLSAGFFLNFFINILIVCVGVFYLVQFSQELRSLKRENQELRVELIMIKKINGGESTHKDMIRRVHVEGEKMKRMVLASPLQQSPEPCTCISDPMVTQFEKRLSTLQTEVYQIDDKMKKYHTNSSALPVSYHKIWRQGDIENFLMVKNLPAMSQMTACFYFKPSHIGHAGKITHDHRALISIASDSDDNAFQLAFKGHRSQDLQLSAEPTSNTIITNELGAAFSEPHRHCFVWNDGSYLKWFYDSETPGVLKLAGQTADSGRSIIPAGSTLVVLNEQDSKGGSLDTRQMIAGDIADFQMWDRAFSNSQVRALGCAEVGNVVTFDDIIPVGISHFHHDSTFQCSNIN